MLETELYLPLKAWLEEKGYTVRGEVKKCDLAAEKNGKIILIELKTAFCLKLVYQALDRQKTGYDVYVCIPRLNESGRSRKSRDMLSLLKKLEIGLITVAADSPVKTVEIVLESGKNKAVSRKKADSVKTELERRSLDLNKGGSVRTKLITAYRERSIKMAAACIVFGKGNGRQLRKMGCDDKDIRLMSDNHYGWFERTGRGIYNLTEKGRTEAADEYYAPLMAAYTEVFLKQQNSEK